MTDLIGGFIGFVFFGIENIVYDLVNYNDRHRNSTEQKIGELLEGFKGTIGEKVIFNMLLDPKNPDIARDTIDREIKRMKEDFVIFEVSKLCTANDFCEKYPWLTWYAFVNNPIHF